VRTGHVATTQRYADCAPNAHEAAFVEAAFSQTPEVVIGGRP
jgi:hypothetical protein